MTFVADRIAGRRRMTDADMIEIDIDRIIVAIFSDPVRRDDLDDLLDLSPLGGWLLEEVVDGARAS